MRSHVPAQPAITPGPVRVQPKLTVNRPGDAYEREADAVADRVLRMQQPGAIRSTVGGNVPGLQRQCAHCEDEKKKHVQRKEAGAAQPTTADAAGYVSDLSSGTYLSGAERGFFEPRMGHDFSQVRIHADSTAAQSARGLNAHAYTIGNHIVFGAGQYRPDTEAGKRLLAHELTHTVQQQTTQTPDLQRTEFAPWPGQAGTDVAGTRQTTGDIIEEQVQRTGDPNFRGPMPALLRYNTRTCELTSTSHIEFLPATDAAQRLTTAQFDALKARILEVARTRLNSWVRIQAGGGDACTIPCKGRTISVNIVVEEGTGPVSSQVRLQRRSERENAGELSQTSDEWTIWHEMGHVALGAADEYPSGPSDGYPGGGSRPAERVNEGDWSIMSHSSTYRRRAVMHSRHYSHLANWLGRRFPACTFTMEEAAQSLAFDYSFLLNLGGFSGAGVQGGMNFGLGFRMGIPLDADRRLSLVLGAHGDVVAGLAYPDRSAFMAGALAGLRYMPGGSANGLSLGVNARAGIGNFDLGRSSNWVPTVGGSADIGYALPSLGMDIGLSGGAGMPLGGDAQTQNPYFQLGLRLAVDLPL